MNSGGRSEGLRRGLEILQLFTDTDFEWGITEISNELGLHKSRVHRAVKTLEDVGFLRKTENTYWVCTPLNSAPWPAEDST